MASFWQLIAILVFVTIHNVQQSECGDDFSRLAGYNLLDDVLGKYYAKNDEDSQLLETGNQLFDQVPDEMEFKPIGSRVNKAYNLYMNSEEDTKPISRGNLELNYYNLNNNKNSKLFDNHEIRDEELMEKSALWRHQQMQGGAGEGEQKLKPDGSISNVQVVKTDSIIPAYCTPPNPCPTGYSSEDGCLENFKNTASFSREYQSMQNCMCDSEHMFNCDLNDANKLRDEEKTHYNKEEDEERELNTIARSLANQPIGEDTANQLISTLVDHKVVAKKFTNKDSSPYLSEILAEERLPVVAKKSPNLSQN